PENGLASRTMYHEAGFRAARRLVRVPMHSARGRAFLLRLEAAEEREAAALPLPPGLEILAGPAKRGVFMLDGDEVAAAGGAGLPDEALPVELAEARQYVPPPALPMIADLLQPVLVDGRVLAMQDLDPRLHLLEGGMGVDAEPDQMRGVEFQAEAAVGHQPEQLLPASRGRGNEIVVGTGPVLDGDLEVLGRTQECHRVLREGLVVVIRGKTVVPARKNHEDRHVDGFDRLGERLSGRGAR